MTDRRNSSVENVTHHTSFIVSHHGIVAACHPSQLSHLKCHIEAIGKSILTSGEQTIGFFLRSRWCLMRQFPGLYSTSWRVNDDFHFPEDPETQQLLSGLVRPLHHLHRKTELVWMPAKVNDHCISTTWTYINQFLCPKHFRDFMSQQILLGSANPVNVHSLNYNLSVSQNQEHQTHLKQTTVGLFYDQVSL